MNSPRSVLLLPSALASFLTGATSASGQIIFSDNFDAGASPQWGNEVGAWSAAGGLYNAAAPNNSPPTYSSLPFNLGDFSITVDIKGVSDGGIWARSSDNANGVLLVTGAGPSGLYWHTIQAGVVSAPIAVAGGLFALGSDIQVRLDAIGDHYAAYLNGSPTPATEFDTALFPTGKTGLYDFSSQTFDNVQVSAVPEVRSSAWVALGLLAFGGWARGRRAARA